MKNTGISNLLTELNKAEVLERELWVQARSRENAGLFGEDYRALINEHQGICESIDQLTMDIDRVFLSVAVHVAGNHGARILIADIDGEYFMGLQDYNHFSIEIKCITKSLYDALKENENTLKDLTK